MESPAIGVADLMGQVEVALNGSLDRPLCLHRLYDTLVRRAYDPDRDQLIELTRTAAERLVEQGLARRAFVSAIAIGAHCEDEMFWSSRSPVEKLEDFGPEYEPMAMARRLASHFQCHGL